MKTTLLILFTKFFFCSLVNGQVYRTVASGNWNSPATWDMNGIPPVTIASGVYVHINHAVTYNQGTSITNKGTFKIYPTSSVAAKFIVPSGINFENKSTGFFYMNAGSYLQYRFVGSGNSGVPQSGTFKNQGGIIEISNSYVEIAQDWISEKGGKRTFKNGCLITGQNFTVTDNDSQDSLINTNISIGWHGSGNFSVSGAQIYFQGAKINIANSGDFSLNSGIVKGNISNISFKHPITNSVNNGNLYISNSVDASNGLSLDIYCVSSPSNFIPNGKINNTPILDCSISSGFMSCTQPVGGDPLPLKLLSFAAVLNNNKIDLKWTTSEEINVSHFVIERSTNGRDYSDAGLVFAYGNATSKSDYALTDNISNIQSTVIYYRLRSVDVDGKYEYSQTRIIRISKTTDNIITITTYPNPVTNEVRITIPANWQNKKVIYELFSVTGQATKRIETGSSSQTETLNMSNLNSGLYLVKVTCEGQTAQQKLVKQ